MCSALCKEGCCSERGSSKSFCQETHLQQRLPVAHESPLPQGVSSLRSAQTSDSGRMRSSAGNSMRHAAHRLLLGIYYSTEPPMRGGGGLASNSYHNPRSSHLRVGRHAPCTPSSWHQSRPRALTVPTTAGLNLEFKPPLGGKPAMVGQLRFGFLEHLAVGP